MADTSHPHLAAARNAASARQWNEAFEAYSAAETDTLDASDLEQWATAGYLLGRVDVARDAMTRAHRSYLEGEDLPGAVRSGFWVAQLMLSQGAPAQAGGWIARIARLVDDLPTDCVERFYPLLFESFRLVALEGRYAEGVAAAERVVEVTRRGQDPDLLALALNVLGRGKIRLGQVNPGLNILDEAMVAVISGELSPPAAGTVYCSLIEACEEISEVRRASEWTDALTRWCDSQHGMVTFTGQCLTHRATIQWRRGDWNRAIAEVEEACVRFQGAADEGAIGAALYQLGEIHRLTGDHDGAENAFRQAGERGHDPQPGLSLLRLAQGDIDSAAAALRRVLSETRTSTERIRYLPAHFEVMLAAGDLDEARRVATELGEVSDSIGTPALKAKAAMAWGRIELASGEPEAALGWLRAAHEEWSGLDMPYDAARAQLLVAAACRRLGDQEGAALADDGARATLVRLKALPLLPELDLEEDGVHHPLSARELEVLRLVATGMTNHEIADELFLAVKTIDRHVGNILTKLEVPSRTAATAYAYENGLL